MSKGPSSIDRQTLNTPKRQARSALEQDSFITRMDKEVFGDELRRKMHQDLIDSYDEELENEIDDYVRDFRFDGRAMSEQEKLDRRTYFEELLRLQRELIKLQD